MGDFKAENYVQEKFSGGFDAVLIQESRAVPLRVKYLQSWFNRNLELLSRVYCLPCPDRAGGSGLAIFLKTHPVAVESHKGHCNDRIQTLKFTSEEMYTHYIINYYFPAGNSKEDILLRWEMLVIIQELCNDHIVHNPNIRIVLAGDLNMQLESNTSDYCLKLKEILLSIKAVDMGSIFGNSDHTRFPFPGQHGKESRIDHIFLTKLDLSKECEFSLDSPALTGSDHCGLGLRIAKTDKKKDKFKSFNDALLENEAHKLMFSNLIVSRLKTLCGDLVDDTCFDVQTIEQDSEISGLSPQTIFHELSSLTLS